MKKLLLSLAATLSLSAFASPTVLTEAFENPFAAWETNWLAANSNLQSIYGARWRSRQQPGWTLDL